MRHTLLQKLMRQCAIGIMVGCLWLSFGTAPALAEGGDAKSNSEQGTDNLAKQITDLDGQIQKLREQSLALQEKTKAKLQQQLEILKKQRDTLVPRIEKLRDNSELAWQDIKENIQRAIQDLKTSVETIEKK